MRQLFTTVTITALVVLASVATSAAPASAGPRQEDVRFFVLAEVAHDVGGPVNAAPASDNRDRPQREIPLRPGGGSNGPKPSGTSDGALQTSATAALGTTLLASFDGVGVGITPKYSDCCAPPDANLAAGPTQVVQWVNLDYAVFDKSTHALKAGPTPGNTVWATAPAFTAGNCATNNDGDPIVKYDQLHGRWIMTQFSVSGGPPYYQCIAVSTGVDASGAPVGSDFLKTTWNRYAFTVVAGNEFPDYPKFAVWPDAYYASFNLFLNGQSFDGAAACAFDAAAMRAGSAATEQCFQLPAYGGLLPSDLDGATGATGSTALPPNGAPNYFMNFGTNALNLWQFHADLATPSNTTLTGPTTISVAAFSTACGGGACIPQLGTGQKLDSLGDRLMYRLAYRNFGDHESLVVTHSVTGSGTAAPRWYELRTGTGTTSTVGSGAFAVYQQSSYAPDATYRWMGSAAMDRNGDLALGYSASSKGIYPAIRYTGRTPGDALGTLRQEATIQPGGGAQSGFGLKRWGDYSSMVTDPSDDCTFWFTAEYLKSTGAWNWSTRIASFKFPGC